VVKTFVRGAHVPLQAVELKWGGQGEIRPKMERQPAILFPLGEEEAATAFYSRS